MIKIEHSVFALPFALVGMMYAANGFPGWKVFGFIVLAMVSARSAAMAWNRIADKKIDAINPRTNMRAIPAGLISSNKATLFFLASCALFFLSAWQLNPLTLYLAPVALFVLIFYSYTKRFTFFCHFWLGFSLGIAPAAAWVAVTGHFEWTPLFLIFGVMFWTAGFDILYALQDDEFDQVHKLKSIPAQFGRRKAIAISRISHTLAILFLILSGVWIKAGIAYFFGCAFAALMLTYEQSMVKENDLSKLNMAFFTLNGYVSVGFFLFALTDIILRLA